VVYMRAIICEEGSSSCESMEPRRIEDLA